tara:strand:+ start:201 stop:932 length:732 start_codon:yes stop_codon:yes gene_type:complete
MLVSNYQIVKSRNFSDYRVVGNFQQTIGVFNIRNVDEIIILDIDSSKKSSGINLEVLKFLSKYNIMPLSYGGGINTLEDISACLKLGCDKIVLNSKIIEDESFIKKASEEFGSQCIVASIDLIKKKDEIKIFSHKNNKVIDKSIYSFLEKLQKDGAGEILINSYDNDGVMNGYDTDLINKIQNYVEIPLMVAGGCGNPKHIADVLKKDVDAACAGSIFFYTEYGYGEIKDHLIKEKINVRPKN